MATADINDFIYQVIMFKKSSVDFTYTSAFDFLSGTDHFSSATADDAIVQVLHLNKQAGILDSISNFLSSIFSSSEGNEAALHELMSTSEDVYAAVYNSKSEDEALATVKDILKEQAPELSDYIDTDAAPALTQFISRHLGKSETEFDSGLYDRLAKMESSLSHIDSALTNVGKAMESYSTAEQIRKAYNFLTDTITKLKQLEEDKKEFDAAAPNSNNPDIINARHYVRGMLKELPSIVNSMLVALVRYDRTNHLGALTDIVPAEVEVAPKAKAEPKEPKAEVVKKAPETKKTDKLVPISGAGKNIEAFTRFQSELTSMGVNIKTKPMQLTAENIQQTVTDFISECEAHMSDTAKGAGLSELNIPAKSAGEEWLSTMLSTAIAIYSFGQVPESLYLRFVKGVTGLGKYIVDSYLMDQKPTAAPAAPTIPTPKAQVEKPESITAPAAPKAIQEAEPVKETDTSALASVVLPSFSREELLDSLSTVAPSLSVTEGTNTRTEARIIAITLYPRLSSTTSLSKLLTAIYSNSARRVHKNAATITKTILDLAAAKDPKIKSLVAAIPAEAYTNLDTLVSAISSNVKAKE